MSHINHTVQKVITLAECKPPYWKSFKTPELSLCNTREQLERIRYLVLKARYRTGPFECDILPCHEIQKIELDHSDTDFNVQDVFGDAGTAMENLDATTILDTWVANSKFQSYR